MRVFIDAALGQFADIEALTHDWRPHVIVADPTMFGAGFAHDRLGIPLATVSVLPCVLRSRDAAPFRASCCRPSPRPKTNPRSPRVWRGAARV